MPPREARCEPGRNAPGKFLPAVRKHGLRLPAPRQAHAALQPAAAYGPFPNGPRLARAPAQAGAGRAPAAGTLRPRRRCARTAERPPRGTQRHEQEPADRPPRRGHGAGTHPAHGGRAGAALVGAGDAGRAAGGGGPASRLHPRRRAGHHHQRLFRRADAAQEIRRPGGFREAAARGLRPGAARPRPGRGGRRRRAHRRMPATARMVLPAGDRPHGGRGRAGLCRSGGPAGAACGSLPLRDNGRFG